MLSFYLVDRFRIKYYNPNRYRAFMINSVLMFVSGKLVHISTVRTWCTQWISWSVNTCTMYTINGIYIKGKFQDTQHCLRNTMNFIIISLSLSLRRCVCADCGSDVPDVCQRSDLDAPPLAQLPVLVLWILCPVRILCCILWNLSVFEINRDPSQARQSNHGNREETRASPPSNRNGTTHETPSLWT